MWPHQAAKYKDSSPVLVLWQSFVSAPQTPVTPLSDFLQGYHSPNKKIMKIKSYVIPCHTSHCQISPVYDRLENRSLKLFPQMEWAVSTLQAADVFRTLIHVKLKRKLLLQNPKGLYIFPSIASIFTDFLYILCGGRGETDSQFVLHNTAVLLCKFRVHLSLTLKLKVTKEYNFSGVSGTVSLLFLSLATRSIKLTPWNSHS